MTDDGLDVCVCLGCAPDAHACACSDAFQTQERASARPGANEAHRTSLSSPVPAPVTPASQAPMLGPEDRAPTQHSSASQVFCRAAAGPGMGPAPAGTPHPRARAARGAPFAAQPGGGGTHPAAAPAQRLPTDAALAALLGEGRHAAFLLSVAWVAAYGFAARVRTFAACSRAAHDASPRYVTGHASCGAVAAVRSNLRGGLALFGAPHSRFLSPAHFRRVIVRFRVP